MKIAVVIFSYNADNNNLWRTVLHSYFVQKKVFATYILVDSESTDLTISIAKKYGWNIIVEKKESFNHGATRQKMIERLYAEGFEIAIFATQDVILASDDTLFVLVDNLQKTRAGVAYARQIPNETTSFDGYFRLRNYPTASIIKSMNNVKELGLMTPFCSNSLAAWDLKKACVVGGFPKTDFGEDMLLGAKFLFNGDTISYCAESCCLHEHHLSLHQIFMRGVGIGKLHGANPLLKEKFGCIESCAVRTIKISEIKHFIIPLAIKYFGYIIGILLTKMNKWNWLTTALVMIVICLNIFFCALNIIPANDTCERYAPMAEAFAGGNWEFAFHPMYGTLFSTLSGVICYIFSLNGFRACQLAALLLWLLSILPLYKIFKYTFDQKVAQCGCVAYILCSHLHRYVHDGLRDNGRTLGLALLCLGMLKIWQNFKDKSSNIKDYIILALGGTILTTLRADGFLIACLCLCFAIFIDILTNKIRIWRSIIAGLIFLFLISPQIYLTWKHTGLPSVSTRHSEVIQKIVRGIYD